MQIEATSATAVEDPRWIVDELIDFMESCLPRNPRDLKLHGLKISDSLSKASKWLDRDSKQRAKVSLESIAANVAVSAVKEIITQTNSRLRRTRKLVPLESLRAQDARCLMWLARRPGNNLNEKLTKDRRLLGVVRELSFDVIENRVTNETARLLIKLLVVDPTAWNHADFRKTRATCSEFIRLAESNGIRGLSHSPRPNNALLRDRKYRRIWLAYRWLLARDEFRESVGNRLCRSVSEALMLVVAALPQSLGFELADAAVPCMARPSSRCAWLRDFRIQWFRLGRKSIDLLDARFEENDRIPRISLCWKNFKSDQREHVDRQTKEIILEPALQSGRIEVTILGAGEMDRIYLSEGMNDFQRVACALNSAISAWLQTVPEAIRSTTVSEVAESSLLRFSADGLQVGNRSVDCFCGTLHASDETNPVILAGSGARNRRILGLGGVCGHGWVTPGRLSRSLARPTAIGNGFRELMDRAGEDGAARPFDAISVPAGLPFGFESTIQAANRSNGEDCWLIPQPVAAAIGAAWTENPAVHPAPEEFVCSIDLDGERVDASLLRWTKVQGPSGSKSPAWLHFREIRDADQMGPRSINLVYKVLVRALTEGGITQRDLRGACMQALHQVKLTSLWNLLEDSQASLDVWVFIHTDSPLCCKITADHVHAEASDWLAEAVLPWIAKRLAFWNSREKETQTLLLNGKIFGVPEFRQIALQWCAQQGIMNPVFLDKDHVSEGLRIFLNRHLAGEVTWSEHLPVLEILGRNAQYQPQWLRMFDEEASVSPGGRILMGQTFSFSADKRTFSVPMRCDGERSGQDPSVRIPDGCTLPVALDVQAHYDVGRAGLMMKVRSKELGMMPEITMEWGAVVSTPAEPQELQAYDDPLEDSEIEGLNQKLKKAMASFFEQNGGQNDLRTVIDEVARLLGHSLRRSESSAWRNVRRAAIVEVAGRLAWMHQTGMGDYHSKCLSAPKWSCELTSGTARSHQTSCLESARLQVCLTRALSKMRAAAPLGFIEWSVKYSLEGQDQALRHECIRCLGRTFGPDDSPTSAQVLSVYERIFLDTVWHGNRHPKDRSIWYWSLHASLTHSEDSVARFGLERIQAILDALRFDLEAFSAKPESVDPTLLRNLLAAMLAARHGTRLNGGMDALGPGSEFAAELVRSLNIAAAAFATTWDRRKLESVTILGFLDDTKGATAFRSASPVGQVAEIWDGKVKTLLRQVIDTD